MRTWVIAAILLLLVSGERGIGGEEVKSREVSRVVEAVRRVVDLAVTNVAHQKSRTNSLQLKVDEITEHLSAFELSRLAVISWALYYPGNAEDVSFDEVFYKTTWRCISRVSAGSTKGDLDALLFISEHSKFDGADRGALDEKIEALRRKLQEVK